MRRSEATAGANDWGAVVLEMAGACWVLPEFHDRLSDVELISTFRRNVARQYAGSTTHVSAASVLAELWGAGGALSSVALRTVGYASMAADAPGGLLDVALFDLVEACMCAFLAPLEEAPVHTRERAAACAYRAPPTLRACVERLLEGERFQWAATVRSKGVDFGKRFQHSLALAVNEELFGEIFGEQACEPLVQLLDWMAEALQAEPADGERMSGHRNPRKGLSTGCPSRSVTQSVFTHRR